MDERKTIFDYLEQVFIEFGISVTALGVLCLIFGESAQEISSMFSLGSGGLPVSTLFQFLLISALITVIREVFFSDVIIKKMSQVWRTIWMLFLIVLLMGIFALLFQWFPVDEWVPWAMFLISFAISFVTSVAAVHCKEKLQNKRMEEALQKLKAGMETEDNINVENRR